MGFTPTGLGGRGPSPQPRQQGAAGPHLGVQLLRAPPEPVGLGFWGGERCGPSQRGIWNSAKLCVCG